MSNACALSENVLEKYPDLRSQIGPCEDIVQNSDFESGIIKIQDQKVENSTAEEQFAVQCLKLRIPLPLPTL